ncbi:MAG: CdiA family toxin C-terminal domain-containing protein, partial [Achromobacter piechaudii]
SVAAAVTELTNNALTLSELKQFGVEAASCELLGTCDEVRKKFQDLSIKNQETMVAVCASDPSACQQLYGHYVTQVSEYRAELDKLAGMDLPAGLKTDLAIYLLQNSDAVNIALNTEFAAQIQEKWGIDSETAAQLVAIAAGAVGAIKSGKGPGSTSALPPNFNGSLVAHNTQVGVLNKRGQISGAHNNDSFLETVEITGAKISNKITGERFPGLVEYTYQMPKLNPRGEPSGGYKLPQTKTTYDSSVLSDSKVADMSSRAAAYAQTEFNSAPGVRETNIKIDRYYFHVTKDANTGEVNNSFITMPSRVKNE